MLVLTWSLKRSTGAGFLGKGYGLQRSQKVALFFFLSGHSVCVRSVINQLNFLLHCSVARELWSLVILSCGS